MVEDLELRVEPQLVQLELHGAALKVASEPVEGIAFPDQFADLGEEVGIKGDDSVTVATETLLGHGLEQGLGLVDRAFQHPDLRFHVADGDQGFEEELENLTLQAVSFVVRSHKNAHFDFEVKSLSSVLDPSLERIKTVFPQRPVFFRACADYSRVSIGDYETNEELGSRVFSGSKPV